VPDNVNVGGVNYSTDDVTTLNGATIAAGTSQTQRMKVQYGDDSIARDVSQAFPLPVNLSSSAGNASLVTGTLSVAAAASASTAVNTSQLVLDVSTMGNVGVGVSTAAFVGTLTFEVSPLITPGATDWYTIDLNPLSAAYSGGGVIAMNVAAQTNRMYEGGLFTPKWMKVRLSALTSGSVNIALGAGPGWVESNPMLTASTANIGRAGPQTSNAPTITNATPAATSSTMLAANANRVGYKVMNDSNVDVLINEAGTAVTATNYTQRIRATNGYYESSGTNMVYVGAVTMLGVTAGTTTAAAATTGACRVTEFS
jgi:hypothetical protein